MLKNKNLMMLVMLLILLAVVPVMALTNGSTKFRVSETLLVAGNEIQAGDYDIKWESSNQDVAVTFVAKGKAVAKAQGKVVAKEKKGEENALVIARDSANHKSLKEIRLAGKTDVIVFE